ncbi:uncharacterized protein LOC116416160 [Nasonia vitripennis]|uniref:Uncharacterized protein n=1 Tax=Nasonia vitripennis TaxID=7425 RepID=A0A7M7T764_NASVI|nr:uncharacterized protein LOC116416160 [Nasonia vitripennis]
MKFIYRDHRIKSTGTIRIVTVISLLLKGIMLTNIMHLIYQSLISLMTNHLLQVKLHCLVTQARVRQLIVNRLLRHLRVKVHCLVIPAQVTKMFKTWKKE